MLALALSTLRSRRASFAGALVAVTVAVAFVCATGVLLANVLTAPGAGRFAAVDAVVQANATITVGHGDSASVVTLHPPPRLSAALVDRVGLVGGVGRAVGDLAFPASAIDARGRVLSAPGADRTEGHGWASASLTPYRLSVGRPPAAANEMVIDGRLATADHLRVGQRLQVVAPAGARTFRVSGIAVASARADRGQSALFFSDQIATILARSAGQVNAIGVLAAPGVSPDGLHARLRKQLGAQFTVLDRRHAADADAGDPRAGQREDMIALLGTMGALAAVIAVVVVASTFAFAVAQRRRELALLRAVGATPSQVRRLIAAEALLLAALGGVAGCLIGLPLAAVIGRGLVAHGIAPAGLHTDANWIALLTAFASGLLVAELAVLAAVWRAARVRPAEVLREAALEQRLGPVRGLLGLAALGGAFAMFAIFAGDNAFSFAEVTVLLFALAAALLSPIMLALPATALSLPLRAGAAGLLASTAMATHRRRVGAVAAPIALAVALAGTYAITDASSRTAIQDASTHRVRAPYVLVARSARGLPASLARLAQQQPGVMAAVGILPTTVYLLDPGLDHSGSPWDAVGVDHAAIHGTLDLGVRSGSLASLRGTTVAISSALANHHGLKPGDALNARLADGAPTRLRVGAIYERALGLGDILLSRPLAEAHATVKLDSAVFVTGPPDGRALQNIPHALPTVTVLSRARYLGGLEAPNQTSAWIAWLLIGLISAFAGIAVVNTSVMATADRQQELALVRLIGATPRQARRMLGWEALLTTGVGVGAGALAARLAVARIPDGRPEWHIVIPPVLFGAILAGAASLGLVGSLLPARITLRSHPAHALAHD